MINRKFVLVESCCCIKKLECREGWCICWVDIFLGNICVLMGGYYVLD